jgi:probable HAF family extracellular repeat protein
MVQIGPLGHTDTIGFDINNLGQVAGRADNFISQLASFLYTDGETVWLGSLGGGNTDALALNDHGQLTGSSSPPTGYPHAFLYADGTMRDIAPQWTYSVGTAINNQGEVVGYYATGAGSRPFVYSGGVSTDLLELIDPALGITSGEARGVNDTGQILLNASARTYILTPVPEPAVAFRLVLCLFAWGLTKRRALE